MISKTTYSYKIQLQPCKLEPQETWRRNCLLPGNAAFCEMIFLELPSEDVLLHFDTVSANLSVQVVSLYIPLWALELKLRLCPNLLVLCFYWKLELPPTALANTSIFRLSYSSQCLLNSGIFFFPFFHYEQMLL